MRRRHLGRGGQGLEQEVVALLQPDVHRPHWLVREGADAELLPRAVVHLQEPCATVIVPAAAARQRARASDVQVRSLVGEGGGEDLPRAHVDARAVDDRPGDPVAVRRAQVAQAARHQVQVHTLLVQAL